MPSIYTLCLLKGVLDTFEPYFANNATDNNLAALTYSGGKDTLWNLNWLVRELEVSNVLAVHFNRMNPTVAVEESKATLKQQERIGFPLHIVDLLNSSKNHGKSIMRARDMFLVGVTAPLAVEFGASRIVLEGGFWPEDTPKGEPFTTYQSSWIYFNQILQEVGIPTQAYWRDSNGMNAIEDLVRNRPEWISLVYKSTIVFLPAIISLGDDGSGKELHQHSLYMKHNVVLV